MHYYFRCGSLPNRWQNVMIGDLSVNQMISVHIGTFERVTDGGMGNVLIENRYFIPSCPALAVYETDARCADL